METDTKELKDIELEKRNLEEKEKGESPQESDTYQSKFVEEEEKEEENLEATIESKKEGEKNSEIGGEEQSDLEDDMSAGDMSSKKNTKERYSQIEWTKKQYIISIIQTCLFCYCYVGVGFLNSITGPLMTHLQNNSGVSETQITLILGIKGVGMMIGTPISGFLFNLFKKFDGEKFKWWELSLNRVLLVILILMAGSLIFVPFLNNFFLLCVDYFLQGLFSGGAEVGCNLGIAWVWREKVGPWMQLLHCSSSFGSLVFPLVTALIFEIIENAQVQLVAAFSLCGALILVVVLPLLLVPCPKQAKKLNAKKINKSEYLKNPKLVIKNFFKDMLSYSTLMFTFAGVLKGAATGGYSLFGNMIFQFCQLQGYANDQVLALLTTVFWASFTVGRSVSIFLSAVVPSFILLFFAVGMTCLSYILMIYFTAAWRFSGWWLAVIVHGLFASSISASSMSVPQVAFNIALNPTSTSIVAFGSTLGETVVPFFVTPLQSAFGQIMLLYVLLIVYIFAMGDVIIMYIVGLGKALLDKFLLKKKEKLVNDDEIELPSKFNVTLNESEGNVTLTENGIEIPGIEETILYDSIYSLRMFDGDLRKKYLIVIDEDGDAESFGDKIEEVEFEIDTRFSSEFEEILLKKLREIEIHPTENEGKGEEL